MMQVSTDGVMKHLHFSDSGAPGNAAYSFVRLGDYWEPVSTACCHRDRLISSLSSSIIFIVIAFIVVIEFMRMAQSTSYHRVLSDW